MKAPPGFPNFEDDMKKLDELMQLLDTLNQQARDMIKKRGTSNLSQIQIEPRDPLDILLHELQAESERNKEANTINTNSIAAMLSGLHTANKLLKEILEHLGRNRRTKKNT